MDLNTLWFGLVGVLFTGYAMLDGFDFGVGTLHLLHRNDHDRRVSLNAIGPVWDGNEVWLVTGGGALFAAFPVVYATVFSGLYLPFILLLCALIFRAVAIEFRSKQPMRWWRRLWDVSFFGGSVAASFLFGLAMGNMVRGIPLDADHEFSGTLRSLLHPYALWMGVTTVALFAMHGAIYLAMKTEGELQARVRGWISPCIIAFIICHSILSLATLLYLPHMTESIKHQPFFFPLVVLVILAIANIPRAIHLGRDFQAFLSSGATMGLLMTLFGLGLYPNMVFSTTSPENHLTIYNGASSTATLRIMLNIALIGMPVVLAYTACVYWIFRGKVRLSDNSY
ncbi:MAG: cytochrome d ubiquinol oxidase subunit II [Verrucomicrobiales bacterium]|nr:cytochrome d ubiquinol oxidase subunit II [Verrucomicrobiales bacterium]